MDDLDIVLYGFCYHYLFSPSIEVYLASISDETIHDVASSWCGILRGYKNVSADAKKLSLE